MKSQNLNFEPELEAIIKKCDACTMAMVDEANQPYAVPMNFGYEDGRLFLHSAPEGRKIEILKKYPKVCVTFSTDHELRFQSSEIACSYSMKYRSVQIIGEVIFVDDIKEKQAALDVIMHQYTDNTFSYSEPALKNVCVMEVLVRQINGRAYGY
ncbi:MAG: pyridoxamine 5'-phosphate oxidase family protein [Bacteroidales bacterium]|nr:pyridoxamine 5'-phosphate oxidase family protein [Bacteroidales bacterium]HOI31848.1 pyridoxamine 5'-phosphate oxidase family protein [Bacteroidales bacterium]